MDVPRGNAPGGVFSHFYQGASEGRTYESVFGAVGWQRVDQRTGRRHHQCTTGSARKPYL